MECLWLSARSLLNDFLLRLSLSNYVRDRTGKAEPFRTVRRQAAIGIARDPGRQGVSGSAQIVFQLHCAFSLFIAIFHDDRGIERESPGLPEFTANVARARYNHGAGGDLQRRLSRALI